MVDFIEKARQGRLAAVASVSANLRGVSEINQNGSRNRSISRHQNVSFFSTRVRQNSALTLG